MTARRRGTGARALLSPAVLGAALAWLPAVVTAGVVDGAAGLAAAGLGGSLVLVFLLVGQLPITQAARGRGVLAAGLLLVGYLSRVVLLVVVFVLVVVDGTLDREVLGGTVMVVALGWTAGVVFSFLRWRPPVVDVELPSSPEPSGGVPADETPSSR